MADPKAWTPVQGQSYPIRRQGKTWTALVVSGVRSVPASQVRRSETRYVMADVTRSDGETVPDIVYLDEFEGPMASRWEALRPGEGVPQWSPALESLVEEWLVDTGDDVGEIPAWVVESLLAAKREMYLALQKARILAAIALGGSTVEAVVDDADADALAVEVVELCTAVDGGADRDEVKDAVARVVRAALGLPQLEVPHVG